MRLPASIKTILAALALLPLPLHAQPAPALRQQNETALAKAATPLEKAIALDKLGLFPKALSILLDDAQLAPDDPAVQLHTAIVLDHNGAHAAARRIYDTLFARIQTVQQNLARARKSGGTPPAPSATDPRLLALSDLLNENAAINHVFLGQYDKALLMFTSIYARIAAYGPDETTNRAALWRVWLTAKMRATDGMRSEVALETLIASLAVSTPWHDAMLKLYLGKLSWEKLLAAMDNNRDDAPARERHTTEAHFFAAGYFRYVRGDNETALKLLAAQDSLPYNGVVERLLMRDEIKTLQPVATPAPR